LLQAIYVRIERAVRKRVRYELQPMSESGVVQLRKGDAFPFICVAINHTAWSALGGFDSRFDLYFEDMDLLIRSSELGDAHIAIMPARIHHVGSATTHQQLATTLPVLTWSAYEYLVLHTRLSPLAARIVVGTAVALRLIFVPVAASSPPASHIRGIAKSLAAIVSNQRPRLPQWQG
jgi:GT2 family glycosyltransferase